MSRVVQVHSGDAADQVRQAQELEADPRDARPDVDHLGGHIVADRSRHELHRPSRADSDALHLLQFRLPHLLLDGLLLHPVRRHDPVEHNENGGYERRERETSQ